MIALRESECAEVIHCLVASRVNISIFQALLETFLLLASHILATNVKVSPGHSSKKGTIMASKATIFSLLLFATIFVHVRAYPEVTTASPTAKPDTAFTTPTPEPETIFSTEITTIPTTTFRHRNSLTTRTLQASNSWATCLGMIYGLRDACDGQRLPPHIMTRSE